MLAGIVATLLCAFGSKPLYTPDGYDYAIVMLMDRGIPYERAQAQASRFFLQQPVAKDALMRRWLHGKPEYWELFSVRRVDSWLASLLYPYRGFAALIDVSRVSYVLTAMLLVLLAARFTPLPYGVAGAIALSLLPPWRALAGAALTDALAVALTAATLLAALSYLTRRSPWRLITFAAICGVLTFTRPITYVVLGAALIAAWVALRRGDRGQARAAAWLAGIAAFWSAVIAIVLARAHAPSFGWIVADAYGHLVANGYEAPGQNLVLWYAHEEWSIARHALFKGLEYVLPALAVVGIALRRKDPATPLLAGAGIATWLGALLDPNRFDMVRCVVLPVAPLMTAFACAAFSDGAAVVPRKLGRVAQRLRYFIPRRTGVRNNTVKGS